MIEVENTSNSISVEAVRLQVHAEAVCIESVYCFITPVQVVVEHKEVEP